MTSRATTKPRSLTVSQALALAKKAMAKGDTGYAEELYSAVLEQEPTNRLAKKRLRKLQQGQATDPPSTASGVPEPEIDRVIQLYNTAEFEQAERYCRTLLETYNSHILLNILGAVLSAQQKFQEAVTCYKKAIELVPGFTQALNNCGVALKQSGESGEALQYYRQAVAADPGYWEAYTNMGVALQEQGQLKAALDCHDHAIKLQPNFADSYYNRGVVLQEQGRFGEAQKSHEAAIRLKPGFVRAYCNLGLVLHEQGLLSQALASYQSAIAAEPAMPEAYANLGALLQDMGRLDEAYTFYAKAIELNPEYVSAYSNLLMLMNYLPRDCADDYMAVARRYNELVKSKATPLVSETAAGQSLSKLRIGFVSGDFRKHPVGYFLEALLRNIDTERFELYAYPTAEVFDDFSEELRHHFSGWHSLYGLSDQQAAELIVSHGVHVLIDLAGHTQNNRLPVFAFKPAPLQVSWLGYFATTGLDTIDCLVGDEYVTPMDGEEKFTEAIWRLAEARWCYSVPRYEIEVSPLPALGNGYITFGCLNNLSKINAKVMMLWSRVLTSVPGSRLKMKSYQFSDEATREAVLNQFASLGVESSRISIEEPGDFGSYLQTYSGIDIVLDTFPFSGGTTSIDSLWMGVPVLTLEGRSLVSRQGVGVLNCVGLTDWIAATEDEYLEKVVAFARDIESLSRLRASLRERALASPLFDGEGFARRFEAAISAMWAR